MKKIQDIAKRGNSVLKLFMKKIQDTAKER